MKACRDNNDRVLANQSAEPEVGGNTEAYKRILGTQSKSGDVDEATYVGWEGNGMEMVLMNLLIEYENYKYPPKDSKDTKPTKPALLDPLTVKMGISYKAHKKVQNVAQLIYVRQLGNAIE